MAKHYEERICGDIIRNPDEVPLTIREEWCEAQREICDTICGGLKNVGVNNCDASILEHNCQCSDSFKPDLSLYDNTIPAFQRKFSKKNKRSASEAVKLSPSSCRPAHDTQAESRGAPSFSTRISIPTSVSPPKGLLSRATSGTTLYIQAAIIMSLSQDDRAGNTAALVLAIFGSRVLAWFLLTWCLRKKELPKYFFFMKKEKGIEAERDVYIYRGQEIGSVEVYEAGSRSVYGNANRIEAAGGSVYEADSGPIYEAASRSLHEAALGSLYELDSQDVVEMANNSARATVGLVEVAPIHPPGQGYI